MNILHYSLGFPPYRSGGLTKYCVDLMQSQIEQGNQVGMIWAGQIRLFCRKTSIKKHKTNNKVASYEIINPLPVPLDEGIKDIDRYTAACDMQVYSDFLHELHPDIIHIHTLMGMHKEFLDVAKSMKIRLIYTTHDYFGICAKVTLFYNGDVCNDTECYNCEICNQTAISLKKIYLLQSSFYRKIKNNPLVKILRHSHRANFFDGQKAQIIEDSGNDSQRYKQLRNFYVSMFRKMDIIHFNSTVSEKIFKYFIPDIAGKVVGITHRNISDNRKIKVFNSLKLHITYLASTMPLKGFRLLITALDELWHEGHRNFKLKLYCKISIKRDYFEVNNAFTSNELNTIFDDTDLFVAPSIGYDTYGFTVLEALSYGVPVIVSSRVGAKDLLKGMENCIIESNCKELKKKIFEMYTDRSKLVELNKNIVHNLQNSIFNNNINTVYQT
ncbi:MAG: glycosyltransferase [Cytophagaceae bacterium]|nr:glycosyltransferase [Cytophagaceae bacterium]